MKTIKMQSKQNTNWEFEQQMKVEKKASKAFRQQRQSRKGCWQAVE